MAEATRSGRLSLPEDAPDCLDIARLRQAGDRPEDLLRVLKTTLKHADEGLAEAFWEDAPVDLLVRTRAWVVEQILLVAWQRIIPNDRHMALVAVGGFGRGELHPYSDVDLMVLLDEHPDVDHDKQAIERFVMLLWDAGFYLGHSVRTPEECAAEARKDVATATNLMEARLLAGEAGLFETMRERTRISTLWPDAEFFEAKYEEQLRRHERFEDTAYNLEPNIKEGPGGLRDIQMIGWVVKRHFDAATLHGLVDHGFLTEPEYADLHSGNRFLWRVRFALHLLAGRTEDRLLFDYQRRIAQRFGYRGEGNEPIERFMQDYYRVVMQLERLNERLLQLFREELLSQDAPSGEEIAPGFRVAHGFLEVTDDNLFRDRPLALLKVFLLLARHEELQGVRAATVRLICDNLDLIDDDYRHDPEVMACFLDLLCQPSGIYTQLQRMNRYGVLAALIPEFARVTGRMQFDLFHVYTVDQHILFVVRNLRRFAYGKYAKEFPHAHNLFHEVDHPEILYLAALFHDIGKGRGGDHSELGAVDAADFCSRLPMPHQHRDRVAWLVEQHLLMSQTAQRKDISDPEIVHEFAMVVGNVTRLKYLYLLTMADIAATSPKLWNSWKDGLLWELYAAARDALAMGVDSPVDRHAHTERQRQTARDALIEAGLDATAVDSLVESLPRSAFMRFSPGQMRWAASRVLTSAQQGQALVAVREKSDRKVSEVFVSAPDYVGLVATATSVFDEMGLNVLAARVVTTRDGRSFDLFQVMDANDGPLNEKDSRKLVRRLQSMLIEKAVAQPVRRRLPRRLRPFLSAPEIHFTTARGGTVTAVEIYCTDQPGLLSQLAAAMVDCGVRIHDAMIATFGDRVEDTFLVSDPNDGLLGENLQAELVTSITRHLNEG